MSVSSQRACVTAVLASTTEPPARLTDSHIRKETKRSDFKWAFSNSFDKMRLVCRDAARSENLGEGEGEK